MEQNPNCRRLLALLIGAILFQPCAGRSSTAKGVVESVHFPTRTFPPVFRAPASQRQYEPIFQTGLRTLPESVLVTTAILLSGQTLGLSTNEAQALSPLLVETYRQMSSDAMFRGLPSALPFCFSPHRHTNGHYFLYHPEILPENPKVLVFLHGFGGNFQFYTWVMKESLPDAIIIAPSWGASWHHGSLRYLEDAIHDAGKRLNLRIQTPLLVGISAGGRGGFRLYNQSPSTFGAFVCLASAPEDSVARELWTKSRILMINGTRDTMAPITQVRALAVIANKRAPKLRLEELDADHFFILSKQSEVKNLIGDFLRELQN